MLISVYDNTLLRNIFINNKKLMQYKYIFKYTMFMPKFISG